MRAYNPRQFSEPDKLKEIFPALLVELLLPYKDYLASRNITLPSAPTAENIDYDSLSKVVITPTDAAVEMSEALHCINEMSSPAETDALLENLQAKGFEFEDKKHPPTHADIAVKSWLCDRSTLERKHAERQLTRQRSFEHYQTDREPVPKFKMPKDFILLEKTLDSRFEEKKRGKGSKVFAFQKQHGIWFMVRHGETYSRQGTQDENGKPGTVYFRPAKHDVLFYDPVIGEISIHADHAWEVSLYREEFGRHIFGDEKYFPGQDKYTLEPLQTNGKASLVCSDIDGMEWIKLKEVRYYRGGTQGEVEIRSARDLFAAWEEREREISPGHIIRASFSVKFKDSKVPRTVVIQPSNIAKYTRDDDATIIERFLEKRGFIKKESESKVVNNAKPTPAVEGA